MITLNLDYLEFNTVVTDSYLPELDFCECEEVRTENFIFTNGKPGGRNFETHWDVFYNGLKGSPKIGLLMCRCKIGGTEANKQLVKFRFADWLFYYSDVPYEDIKNKLCDQIGVVFKSISRVDIALDTDEAIFLRGYRWEEEKKSIEFNDDLSGGLTGADVMRAAKCECLGRDPKFNRSYNECLFDFFGRGNKTFTTYFGSKKGDQYARMYDKTEEMRSFGKNGGEKDYITECWEHNGYDHKNNVYRFEIVLQHLSNSKKDYQLNCTETFFIKDGLKWCNDLEKIKAVFQGFVDRFFMFRKYGTKLHYVPIFDTGKMCDLHKIQLSDKKVLVSLEDIVLQHQLSLWCCKYIEKMAFSDESAQIFTKNTRKKLESAWLAIISLHHRYDKTPRRSLSPRYLTGGYRLVKNSDTKINI